MGAAQFNKAMEINAETDIYQMMVKILSFVSAAGTSMEYLYETTIDHLKEYKIDGMIAGANRCCRAWTSHSLVLAKLIQERTGLPCITPDIDMFIDRGYFPQERMRTVLETFADIVKRPKRERETLT